MNNFRVYLTVDDETTTVWVDAKSEQHACFLIGVAAGKAGTPAETITRIIAVPETN